MAIFTFEDNRGAMLIFDRGKKITLIRKNKTYVIDQNQVSVVKVWHPENTRMKIVDLIDVKTNTVINFGNDAAAELCLVGRGSAAVLKKLIAICKRRGLTVSGIAPVCSKNYIEDKTNAISYMRFTGKNTVSYFPLGQAPIPLSVKDTEFFVDKTEISMLIGNRVKTVTSSNYEYTLPMRIRVDEKLRRPLAKFVNRLKKCGYTVYEKGKCTDRYLEDDGHPAQFLKLSRDGKAIFYYLNEPPMYLDSDDTQFIVRENAIYATSESAYKKMFWQDSEIDVGVTVKQKYKKCILNFAKALRKRSYKVKFR